MTEWISEWRKSNNDKKRKVMCRRQRNKGVRGMENTEASKQEVMKRRVLER